jgi:hypothetical protein
VCEKKFTKLFFSKHQIFKYRVRKDYIPVTISSDYLRISIFQLLPNGAMAFKIWHRIAISKQKQRNVEAKKRKNKAINFRYQTLKHL